MPILTLMVQSFYNSPPRQLLGALYGMFRQGLVVEHPRSLPRASHPIPLSVELGFDYNKISIFEIFKPITFKGVSYTFKPITYNLQTN